MPFDPYVDPWGAAMLACAGLAGFGLLGVSARRLSDRPGGWAGWLMGVGLAGFLGTTGVGTSERIRTADAAVPDVDVDVDVDADADVDADVDVDVDAGPGGEEREQEDDAEQEQENDVEQEQEDDAEQEQEQEDDAEQEQEDDAEQAQGGARDGTPPPPPPPLSASASLDPVPPLPSEPAELRAAVRAILLEGKNVAIGTSCKDAAKVGNAWAKLSRVPAGVYAQKVAIIHQRLDGCRRKVLWTTTYKIHKQRVLGRDAFVKTLKARLREQGHRYAYVVARGAAHEKLRIGATGIDDNVKIDAMLDAGLKAELEQLGFASVLFAAGKKSWKRELAPRVEKDLIRDALTPWGLATPLKRPAP